ncbi:helix-turn-helix domain-containing protein [Streptomyces sp. Ru73]|uniref:helix-turn-helix transcriptional regulator n=1 Tax=Streptomyces sp. Ru73 TaxID=2080748 RepID=UPI0021562AF0|nr:helix-turn-helix domain-containing protein [Streptomyces sp. Ru73]
MSTVNKQATTCSFLTRHARVLLAIVRDPTLRIRDIAWACHITERTAQKIIADLEEAGYLSRRRTGRRVHYTPHLDGAFRHPAEVGLPIRALLDLLTPREAAKDAAPAQLRAALLTVALRWCASSPKRCAGELGRRQAGRIKP